MTPKPVVIKKGNLKASVHLINAVLVGTVLHAHLKGSIYELKSDIWKYGEAEVVGDEIILKFDDTRNGRYFARVLREANS